MGLELGLGSKKKRGLKIGFQWVGIRVLGLRLGFGFKLGLGLGLGLG